MTKALVTGSRGFVGVHLEEALQDQEIDVIGFDLKTGDDICDYEQVRLAIDQHQPDYIFHLAAMAIIGESQLNPWRSVDVQVTGSLNILEAVRNLNVRPKILFASTSEEYGYENQLEEVTEESPTIPQSVYGATKNTMTNLANIYAKQYGLHVVVTRAFNHLGPGKNAQFADTSFAKQIANIERGEQDILRHGNLETIRNYTDVRDIVHAYMAVIDATPGIYNVCSINNVSMSHLLEVLITKARCPIITEVDEHLYRPGTSVFHEPSYAKLNKATGWRPTISFERSISDLLDYWRHQVI